ncbi:hypothetical protein GCM10011365_05530 [Marinicella pacifica]|uniref:TOD1/MUCI70 glycosyltransferase-like domain-containing protein n=1 Tax=Marinicella pacifica TaxID=1171543 RepID=A0A917CI68_9GAMM|nr:glycosyltransferase domain-containing protein [Marinicella pacifica]GGF87354.1 hypothetical protein GCM10011365_05530 [Marinicella pacifica]
MIRGIIYTAITNGYDTVKTPKTDQTLPMVCFQNSTGGYTNRWESKKIDLINDDPIRTARFYKLHPHLFFPNYDWSIWVDGSLLITDDLIKLLNEAINNKAKLAIYKHAKRNCLYQAAHNCIDKNKDSKEVIEKQIDTYKSIGYPQNNGLVASGVIVRRHNDPQIIELMNNWWSEIYNHSRRDQISFNYACWKMNFKYWEIPTRIGDGRYFMRNPHA